MLSTILRRHILLTLLVLLFLTQLVGAETISGRVVGISDGDTITVLDAGKRQHKIRLYGIDCPESVQAFGRAANHRQKSLIET